MGEPSSQGTSLFYLLWMHCLLRHQTFEGCMGCSSILMSTILCFCYKQPPLHCKTALFIRPRWVSCQQSRKQSGLASLYTWLSIPPWKDRGSCLGCPSLVNTHCNVCKYRNFIEPQSIFLSMTNVKPSGIC